MADNEMRFSDAELIDMKERLDSHISEFRDHVAHETERWDHLLSAIEDTNTQVRNLSESTHGLVEAWTVATGGIRLLVILGNIAKWLASLAIFAGIANYFGFIGGEK